MSQYSPGDDVWIDFEGGVFPAEVIRVEKSGYVLCKAHLDLCWDYGLSSSRLDPEQIVAVRVGSVTRRGVVNGC